MNNTTNFKILLWNCCIILAKFLHGAHILRDKYISPVSLILLLLALLLKFIIYCLPVSSTIKTLIIVSYVYILPNRKKCIFKLRMVLTGLKTELKGSILSVCLVVPRSQWHRWLLSHVKANNVFHLPFFPR